MSEPFIPFINRELGTDPVLIACGLPASYKTETTQVVAREKGYQILRTDLLRLKVLKNEDIFDERVAANMDKRELVYNEMFQQADKLAKAGTGVILDATFVTQALRQRAAKVAADNQKTLVIQQTPCPEEISLKRISLRTKENYESNALTPVAYYNNLKKFEPVDLDDLKQRHLDLNLLHLLIDTTSNDEAEWKVIDKQSG